MWKRIGALILCLTMVVGFCGCSTADDAIVVSKTPSVTAEVNTQSMLAAKSYCGSMGYEFIESATLTDGAVCVENGKYDYLVADEFSAQELKNFDLKLVENCEYNVEYCLGFLTSDNELCSAFNKAINDLTEDGTIKRIEDSYKGIGDYTTPATVGKPINILCTGDFGYRLSADSEGNAQGMEVDIVYALCSYLGYTAVFTFVEYDDAFYYLENGEADLIMSVDSAIKLQGIDLKLSIPYTDTDFSVYTSSIS